jgi:DNA repair exonuclease SbcCD ATPase subunit
MTSITLKNVKFSNMFSYGAANTLNLNNTGITQLTATNGSGKSSLALVIQELLFNKNVKNIKKGDILNRFSGAKTWNGTLLFSVDDNEYSITVNRAGATTKVILLEDGVDISDHKVLDTYKNIQDILGLNFEIFSQLTYQSSTDLLDFLRATDINRKKFLINLFNLNKYIEIGDKLKFINSAVDREVLGLTGELKSINDFLDNTSIPETQQEVLIEDIDTNKAVRVANIEQELKNINATCMRIDKNNMYIDERNSLKFDAGLDKPEPYANVAAHQTLKFDLMSLHREIAALISKKTKLKITDTCPSCGQDIDNSHLLKLKADIQAEVETKGEQYNNNLPAAEGVDDLIETIRLATIVWEDNNKNMKRFEELSQLIDTTIAVEYPDAKALSDEVKELKSVIAANKKLFDAGIAHNKGVSAHNAKVLALEEQKSDFLIRQQAVESNILDKSTESTQLGILKKAFSPSGIVAFKLENLTKELENAINVYLSVLSDGQFQVEFTLEKEKLNISVINNGIKSPIETMSGGEFSRIQTSVLLAIRSLLSKLGGSSVNLLFLDEITGVLDSEGKEKLIEILQAENELNVFLISHDFTHPLISKISINKDNNISSIAG